jgi:hypothetical protein
MESALESVNQWVDKENAIYTQKKKELLCYLQENGKN